MSNEPPANSRKRTWEKRLDSAKQRHRPKLKNWARDGFATSRNNEYLKLFEIRPYSASSSSSSSSPPSSSFSSSSFPATIDRISCYDLSVKKFVELYENPYRPCVIGNIPEAERWRAIDTWTFRNLKTSLGDRLFKVSL